MKIDVISDVVCPWCYIGKKNLEAAMALQPDIDFEVQWFPYQLHPEASTDGDGPAQSLEDKYGKMRVQMMLAQITQAAEAAGISMKFEGIKHGTNTLRAHRLLDLAFNEGGATLQNTLSEALFQAYFCNQQDIGSIEVLSSIAAVIGMSRERINTYLNGNEGVDDVKKQIALAGRQGVNGVPSFSFEGQFVLSGGQAPEVFSRAIDSLANRLDESEGVIK